MKNQGTHTDLPEDSFQNLIREAPVGIIVLVGDELRVQIVNEMYGRIVNLSPEQLQGKPLFDLLPQARETFDPIIRKVLSSGETLQLYDYPYFLNAGDEKREGYLNITYQPYRQKNGTTRGVMILCYEVTEQVKSRKKLEESENYFKKLADTAPTIIWITDSDGYCTYLNKKWYDHTGQSKEEAEGFGWLNATHPDDKALTEKLFLNANKNQTSFNAVYRLKNTLGNYRWMKDNAEPKFDEQGNYEGMIGTVVEIHEQKIAEEKTKEAEEKAILAIESADLGTYELNLLTEEMKTSERFRVIWGVDHHMQRKDFANYIHTDDRELRMKAHQESLITGNLHYEARLVNEGRPVHWIKVKGKVLYENGTPVTLLGVIQDITEQKLFAEELKIQVSERTAELHRSNEDLLQFAHVTSHDLKEPVRKIKTFNNRLQTEFGSLLPEKANAYLNKVEHATDRMFSMIEGVLTYSTLNSSDEPIEKINLNEIIRHIETDLEVFIQKKEASLTTQDLPEIEGANVLIHQLFYNLINNSLKFSREGIKPHISIEGAAITYNNAAFAKITVTDNGIGFEKEFDEKIFNAFSRLHPKDLYEGTGLGLALCKRIVERHHGFISAKAAKNMGAEFTILLPLSQSQNKI